MSNKTQYYKDLEWQDGHSRVFVRGVWVSYADLNAFIDRLKEKDRPRRYLTCSEYNTLGKTCKGCVFQGRCDEAEETHKESKETESKQQHGQ